MLTQLGEAPEAELWARKALGNLSRAMASCWRPGRRRCAAWGMPDRQARCATRRWRRQGRSAFRWQVRGEWMLACKQKLEEHCFAKAQQLDGDWLVALESALIYLHYEFPSRAVVRARLATELAPDEYHPWYVRRQGRGRVGARSAGQAKVSITVCNFAHATSKRARKTRADEPAVRPTGFWKACRNFFKRK